MTNLKWWLWLHLNCGGGLCLVQYLSWRLSTEWPLHVTKTIWSRIQVTYHHENKTTISDIPLRFHHIKNHYISLCPRKVFCLISCIRSRIGLILQLFWAQRQQDLLHYFFIIIWPPNVPQHTESHLQTDLTNDQVSCHHSSHYQHCVDAPDDVLLTLLTIFQAEWCSKNWSVAQVLTLLSFCCLYFAFTGNRCLYFAYV